MRKIFIGLCLLTVATCTNADFVQAQEFRAKAQVSTNQNLVTQNLTILGEQLATPEQAVQLIKTVNPKPLITCSVEELVEHYFQEAKKEGIRGDVALSQALLETGFFRYGGSVDYRQNNFCGLGSTGKNVGGAKFADAQIGVRAHIQHLLVYSSKKNPSEKIVDPRFEVVKKIPRLYATAKTWHDLDGRWAMSRPYGSKILNIHSRMLAMPVATKKEEVKAKETKKAPGVENKKGIKARVQAILKNGK